MPPASQAGERAENALRAAQPREALRALEECVRASPGRTESRIRLLQVLCILGEWDRARTQIALLPDLDRAEGDLILGASTFAALVEAECERAEVFAGRRTPRILGEPAAWMALQSEAVRLLAVGDIEAAARAIREVRNSAEATPGRLDGQAFAWIADADPRFGPLLEVFVERQHFWVPFAHLRRVEIAAPADLQDRVWLGTELQLKTGTSLQGYIPVRYPGSHSDENGGVQMAAVSDWREVGSGLSLGMGQRLVMTDTTESPLFRVRRIELDPTA